MEHRRAEPVPSVAAVIVTWRSEGTIGGCLDALLRADDPALEVVVVDNASPDGTVGVVEEVAARDARVRLIARRTNDGFGAASNIGAAATDRPLLLFLNPDARLEPAALDRMRAAMRDPRVGAVGPHLVDERGVPWVTPRGRPSIAREAVDALRQMLRGRVAAGDRRTRRAGWASGACLLVRRAALHGAAPFDERFFLYFEDKDLCARLDARGYDTVLVDAVAEHRGAASTDLAAGAAAASAYRRSQRLYYEAHRPWVEARALPVLVTVRVLARAAWALVAPCQSRYPLERVGEVLRAAWGRAPARAMQRERAHA